MSFLLSSVNAMSQTGLPVHGSDPTVHDPSVIHVDGRFYVFGSHLDAAYTADLMNWTQISSGTGLGNTLIPNLYTQLSEAFAWSNKTSLWAPDVTQLGDGKFYFYYCASEETSPRASIGIATSESVEGPYYDEGIILRSGMWGQVSPDGTVYDATRHPHCIDPHTFYDAEGKLQMVYGSYSGGIFIMEMNPDDGTPLPGQGYGTHLWGGNHARIEGAYILHNPATDYYYLFVSYYGLASWDGYNIRVARSRDPHGPYRDMAGTDMSTVKGAPGTLFDDASIAPHGVKLIGGYRFLSETGEPRTHSQGYLSPGHNSAYRDEARDKYFLFFHTRFQYANPPELHEVRVHQLYFNEDGWPVIAPHRYAGETQRRYRAELVGGSWKIIEHTPKTRYVYAKDSVTVNFNANGTISGSRTGTWEFLNDHAIRIQMDGKPYRGVVSHQWDFDNQTWVMAFSALSADGVALWGSKVAVARSSLETFRLIHFGSTGNSGPGDDQADPDGDGLANLLEYALHRDPRSADEEVVAGFLVDARLGLRFEQIPDPALRYEVTASDNPASPLPIWSSSGNLNLLGEVTVMDTADLDLAKGRFLQLRITR